MLRPPPARANLRRMDPTAPIASPPDVTVAAAIAFAQALAKQTPTGHAYKSTMQGAAPTSLWVIQ